MTHHESFSRLPSAKRELSLGGGAVLGIAEGTGRRKTKGGNEVSKSSLATQWKSCRYPRGLKKGVSSFVHRAFPDLPSTPNSLLFANSSQKKIK